MRAVLVSGPGAVAIEQAPDPTPGPDDVVVRVRGCGICSTDPHIIHQGLPTAPLPLIPGHEPWGEVVEVHRSAVRGACWRHGRRGPVVALWPVRRCREGRGNLCAR